MTIGWGGGGAYSQSSPGKNEQHSQSEAADPNLFMHGQGHISRDYLTRVITVNISKEPNVTVFRLCFKMGVDNTD